eukprot:a345098_12.p1 GENE.a345098_12~~a345098_12.p1  ORF type:complete len:142 (-),score=49.23 a345098_12:18-419(-)
MAANPDEPVLDTDVAAAEDFGVEYADGDADGDDDDGYQELSSTFESLQADTEKLRAQLEDTIGQAGLAAPVDLEEVNSRSIFVTGVDFSCTEEDVTNHFKSCGDVQRVTILKDSFTKKPKGMAYIEFKSREAV